jgi:putative ABC transport system permease protein
VQALVERTLIFHSTTARIIQALLSRIQGALHLPLIVKLAARNLFHDRLRFIATIIGIVFSIVLVNVQMGLFVSFGRMVTTMIDHASADLWIVPQGTRSFEDPAPLDESERFRALSVKGVADAVPIVIGFSEWRVPGGKATPIFVIGSPMKGQGLQPWNVVEGNLDSLAIPGAVAVDKSYFGRLAVKGMGAIAQIHNTKAQVRVISDGIRSFTTTPYIFATLDRARRFIGMPSNKDTYVLVHLAPGANLDKVRAKLQQTLSNVEVLTPREFGARSRSFWLFGTGAGAALFAGALLGMIVGTVIVAQTLYSSTKDHLYEFATLRAIGSSGLYIYTVIIIQALVSAVIGFSIAAAIGVVVVNATADSALPIAMPPDLTAGLFLLTVAMCVLSAVSAIVKVMRMDPAMVFAR